MKMLIADDERIIREGLREIIDWKSLGFTLCETASNGVDALEKIQSLNPSVVILDLQMPGLDGLHVLSHAVEGGFTGRFIILSGGSELEHVKTVMRYGVMHYLTKPVNEEELLEAVTCLCEQIRAEKNMDEKKKYYENLVRERIVSDLIQGICNPVNIDAAALSLDSGIYQIVSYEKYAFHTDNGVWNPDDLFRVAGGNLQCVFQVEIHSRKFLLLSGFTAIRQFDRLIEHYQSIPQKNSPLDKMFIAYGQKTGSLSGIHDSYIDVLHLLDQRFFCKKEQHIIGYDMVSSAFLCVTDRFSGTFARLPAAEDFAKRFSSYIQSHNKMLLLNALRELSSCLVASERSVPLIRYYCMDLYFIVKHEIMKLKTGGEISFREDVHIIRFLEEAPCLHEIMDFFLEEFSVWLNVSGKSSGENVLDDVFHYIDENYQDDIKLETIAALFNYNSSYLGKVFNQKAGIKFNAYVDRLRMKQAKKLLMDERLRIYEIATTVGYENAEYFHKKFRKIVGMTPMEYRRSVGIVS